MRKAARLGVSLLLLAAPVAAATDWFPPQFEEGATRQLAARLVEIGVAGESGEEERMRGSRQVVLKIVDRVDEWGLEGVLERVPELSEIEFPPTAEPPLAAVARLGACSLPLDPARYDTDDRKFTVAAAEVSVAIVSAFLRHRLLAAGTTDEQMAAYLASDEMNQLSYDVQTDEELSAYVWEECGPVFAALLE